jgi:8-oxo-dGTP pyrophosphatase MutT (NUDIX family)
MPDASARLPLPPDAATIVLLRDGPGGVEVLLLQRHPGSRMAPGAFAFPGGRLEPADGSPAAVHACRGLTAETAAAILGDVRPGVGALGFWIAALRELFEETGILLAYTRDGSLLGPAAPDRARLADLRARSRDEPGAFPRGLRAAGLTLATDRLVYYARWITPEARPVRYDTRFFAAPLPSGLEPEPDGVEIVGWRWLSPTAALERHAAGSLTLPFPTQQILRSMTGMLQVDALLQAARARTVEAIRPRLLVRDGRERILLPGEPGYS